MKKVHFFWYGFVNDDVSEFTKGGVQTYLLNLKDVFAELDYEVHFYRISKVDVEKEFNGIHFHLCKSKKKYLTDGLKVVFKTFAGKSINANTDIILFADDLLSFPVKGYKTITLQHGIFWDVAQEKSEVKSFVLSYLKKQYEAIIRLKHSTYADFLVCVDYNYQNWYRSMMPYSKSLLVVNPNFTKIIPPIEKPHDKINIMFARRYEKFRGTRIFGEAISKILSEYDNVNVTMAGWGTDEQWLRNKLGKYNHVEFVKYDSEDSLEIHKDKHIAVVPTVGSEGTSLSLLEAMSAQCAVIGSDVGGITNILIDNFNGLIVPAGQVNALYLAIKYLIDYPQERLRLSSAGYLTVCNGFSYEKWKSKWKDIIGYVEKLPQKCY